EKQEHRGEDATDLLQPRILLGPAPPSGRHVLDVDTRVSLHLGACHSSSSGLVVGAILTQAVGWPVMAAQQADGLFAGKVVFVTGAARGQGREPAVRFAEEGADVIAVDLCGQLDSVAYPMATPEDLEETVRLVEKTGRRIVAEHADVRDRDRL